MIAGDRQIHPPEDRSSVKRRLAEVGSHHTPERLGYPIGRAALILRCVLQQLKVRPRRGSPLHQQRALRVSHREPSGLRLYFSGTGLTLYID